jgi:hypothetical protein
MTDNDEKVMTAFNLRRKDVELIHTHANANFDGNLSMALRRILDEWKQFKGAQLDLPGMVNPFPQEAK